MVEAHRVGGSDLRLRELHSLRSRSALVRLLAEEAAEVRHRVLALLNLLYRIHTWTLPLLLRLLLELLLLLLTSDCSAADCGLRCQRPGIRVAESRRIGTLQELHHLRFDCEEVLLTDGLGSGLTSTLDSGHRILCGDRCKHRHELLLDRRVDPLVDDLRDSLARVSPVELLLLSRLLLLLYLLLRLKLTLLNLLLRLRLHLHTLQVRLAHSVVDRNCFGERTTLQLNRNARTRQHRLLLRLRGLLLLHRLLLLERLLLRNELPLLHLWRNRLHLRERRLPVDLLKHSWLLLHLRWQHLLLKRLLLLLHLARQRLHSRLLLLLWLLKLLRSVIASGLLHPGPLSRRLLLHKG